MGRRRRRQEETNDDNEGGSGASSPKTCLREGAVLEFKVSHTLEAEPGSTPGFFNTRMQLNRDLTVGIRILQFQVFRRQSNFCQTNPFFYNGTNIIALELELLP
jgi:tRNA G26 N,N-dimethylase Trm1